MKQLPSAGVLGVVVLLLGSCAAAPPEPMSASPGPPDERQREMAATEAELRRHEAELGGLMAQTTPVDCGRARLLRDNICALANRICALAGRTPADASGTARCSDALSRCQAARVKIAPVCPDLGPR
jgi:hypothetical protein